MNIDYGNIFDAASIKYLEQKSNQTFLVFSFYVRGDLQGLFEFENKNPKYIENLGQLIYWVIKKII